MTESDQRGEKSQKNVPSEVPPRAWLQHAVIQLDPEHSAWGPLLCIVDEVKSWGVQCYAIHPEERDKPPGAMYLRVKHEHYVVIGSAQWIIK